MSGTPVHRLALLIMMLLGQCAASLASPAEITVDRAQYEDRIRGFWLGSSIANWTGLATENLRTAPPFFTDADWRQSGGRDGDVIDYVLASPVWGADDDTDIEYVYQHALEESGNYTLTAEEIAAAWLDHVGLPLLWVSNLAALGQMQNGVLPPATSLPDNNPMWEMIDAQLTTEIFGVLAPARPDVALEMARLPIRTTAYLHSEWAAQFYVIMHSLVPVVDPQLTRGEQVRWLAAEARTRIPEWSYIADMYDFVKAEYAASRDQEDWEGTRDRVYERYQVGGAANYRYAYPWDSGINFASSMVSLFYGEGDFKKTIRIGTLAGWDSDNPTATWGGLLGLLYGYEGLRQHFDGRMFSDLYQISRTRYNFPTEPDSFAEMARRGARIVDKVVADGMGGRTVDGQWIIPRMHPRAITVADVDPADARSEMRWTTIEDDDPRWLYQGFMTAEQQWNASGATLTSGRSDCRAQIRFRGSAVRYFAYRNANAGSVRVSIDGHPAADVDLSSRDSDDRLQLGQYYVKVFEKQGLEPGEHRLVIACDSEDTLKTIDMLSVR